MAMVLSRRQIAVVGAASCGDRTARLAEEVGRLLAGEGAAVLTGGGGGVMEAASRGATEAGGQTVGILPGTDRRATPPNAWVDTALFTGLGQARNVVLVLSADAVVAIGGSWGTLSEIALAAKHGRPVVLLDSWSLRPPDASDSGLPVATDPTDAVDLLVASLRPSPSSSAKELEP